MTDKKEIKELKERLEFMKLQMEIHERKRQFYENEIEILKLKIKKEV